MEFDSYCKNQKDFKEIIYYSVWIDSLKVKSDKVRKQKECYKKDDISVYAKTKKEKTVWTLAYPKKQSDRANKEAKNDLQKVKMKKSGNNKSLKMKVISLYE